MIKYLISANCRPKPYVDGTISLAIYLKRRKDFITDLQNKFCQFELDIIFKISRTLHYQLILFQWKMVNRLVTISETKLAENND
jgi:hypothetical protein